jgi:signal transduction histidine kinase
LVKHIVETVHGGQISVASELNSGTTMVLRFPYLAD